MWLIQAGNVATNAPHAPSPEVSPAMTWFFGGMAMLALVMTWIWLWSRMRQSMRERAALREELERLEAERADAEKSE